MSDKVQFVAIPGAKFNSVRLTVPCFSNPLFIKAVQGGCVSQIHDQCLVDTAMAAALLSLLKENMIQITSHKLMHTQMSYYIAYGSMHICITLPAPVGTIKYALKCIRKTISPLLAKRASKLYYKVKNDQKKDASLVHNTIAKTLNGNIQIVAFGRANQQKKFVDSLQTYFPKPLEHSKETINRVQSMIGAEGPYRPMKQFDQLPDACKAIVLASFQIADLDFFTDAQHKNVFVNKQHFTNPQLVSIRKFIHSKTKFMLSDSKSKDNTKNIIQLLSAIYNYSATALMVDKSMLTDDKTRKELESLLNTFSDRFPKTQQQI